jgi:hypothetical protein
MDIMVALIGSMLVGEHDSDGVFNASAWSYRHHGSSGGIPDDLAEPPIFPIILGGLIVIPGVVLFIRFLSKYPLPKQEAFHG